jgi:hypothetical protein
MPVSSYFEGSGKKVMRSMKERYGSEKGEDVFYATANKRGMAPKKKKKSNHKKGKNSPKKGSRMGGMTVGMGGRY